jgi:GMP synthase-like glutamine amidotransferase
MKQTTETKEILIIQNISREGSGLLGEIIEKNGIRNKIVDLNLGDKLPSAEKYAAVVVFGGPDSANDLNPKMQSELAFIGEVLSANIPYLGICLGFQTLVKAAGGKVVKSQVKETGFRDEDGQLFRISLTDAGRKDLLFNGIEDSFNVLHLHGDTVILTESMQLLATGNPCRNQIVKIGSVAYGIQCHFELTEEMLERWIYEDPDLKLLDKNELHNDFSALGEVYLQTGYQLFRNFLRIAGFLI